MLSTIYINALRVFEDEKDNSDGGENSGGGEMRRNRGFLLTVNHLAFMMTIAQCIEKNPWKRYCLKWRAWLHFYVVVSSNGQLARKCTKEFSRADAEARVIANKLYTNNLLTTLKEIVRFYTASSRELHTGILGVVNLLLSISTTFYRGLYLGIFTTV